MRYISEDLFSDSEASAVYESQLQEIDLGNLRNTRAARGM